MNSEIILSTRHLCKYYPGVKAMDDLSIDFHQGEVHAIVGENGAGKSTMIKMIAGAAEPTSGTILIDGQEYTKLTPAQAKEKGIEVIYQEFNLIGGMSCAENVFLNQNTSGGKPIVNFKERARRAKEIFDRLGVDIDPNRPVNTYTPGYMQIVEIAKAISKNIRILIMDEPTAPLTVSEVELMFRIVEDLKAQGITIIYVSHRLEEIFRIADRVSVFRDGHYICTNDIGNITRKELINLMVGRELTESYPPRTVTPGEEVLRIEHLTGNGVEDISFSVQKGEILGFAGLVGAGRTELMNVIYGEAKAKSGKIFIHGKEVHNSSPTAAIRHGIGLIPEDRKNLGVFLNFSINWNTVIMSLKDVCTYGIVSRKKESAAAEKYRKRFAIKAPSGENLVKSLSGGNQQKVVLAKTLAANTEILIFDEPTRGIDVGAKQEIYKLMNELVEEGHTILMVSSDMPELLGMADRVLVICEGKQTGIVERQAFDQAHILELASGEQ